MRIDLWGDEVDRGRSLRRRPAQRRRPDPRPELYPAGAAAHRRGPQAGPNSSWPPTLGREQWQRLADGEGVPGMEAWLPWLVGRPAADPSTCWSTSSTTAGCLLVEPRRLRDRVGDVPGRRRTWAPRSPRLGPRRPGGPAPAAPRHGAPAQAPEAPPGRSPRCPARQTPAVCVLGVAPAVSGGEALIGQRQLVADSCGSWCGRFGSATAPGQLIAEHGLAASPRSRREPTASRRPGAARPRRARSSSPRSTAAASCPG